MPGFLIRLAVNALAVWIAVRLVDISVDGLGGVLFVTLALGVVNALIRPLVFCITGVLTLPLQIITLGLFTLLLTLIINALMFWLALWLAFLVGLAEVPGFGAAFLGALIVSIVSWLLSLLVR
ncbi:MAG: phage holin family protein [Chloroflexi bacterium]|nr:phage holin family protein [Chloroflexota bacterium]